VAVLFSLNYIIGKIGLRHFHPMAFAWLRVAGSAIALQLIVRGRRLPPLPRMYWREGIVYGLLGVVINQLMFLSGLSRTTAHEAAILITTIPIFTLIAALIIGSESVTVWNVLGMLLAGIGAILVIQPDGFLSDRTRLLGDVFVLINCAAYGLYLVFSKPLMSRVPAIPAISFFFSAGTIMMFPFCIRPLWQTHWSGIPAAGWLALAGVIAGPTVAAYILNGWALAWADSTVVAAYVYVQPFLATVLAVVFLHESLETIVVIAGCFIIAGVWLSSRRRPQRAVDLPS
jgi:drug/metabolite transporter (DMT)-like permease